MKIINCFPFYNEVDLLEYKLSILNDYVDYFVLVESTHTFVGTETEPVFEKIKNNEIFSKYKDKIIHIIIDDYPYKKPNINYENNEQWNNEYYHRNYLAKGIEMLQLNDEDVIISGDLDEIVNPELLVKIKNKELEINQFYSLNMKLFYFNLHTIAKLEWFHCKIFNYKTLKESKMSINDIRVNINFSILRDGGWHLAWFGDNKFCKNKIQEFSHVELNHGDTDNILYIKDVLLTNRNYQYTYPQITDLPPYYEPFFQIFFKDTLAIES